MNLLNKGKGLLSKLPGSGVLGPIITVVSILLIFAIIVIIFWYRRYRKRNPIFLYNPHVTTNYTSIPSVKLTAARNGYDYTYNLWLYVGNWFYKYNRVKCILNKGRKISNSHYNRNSWSSRKKNFYEDLQCSPGVFLDPTINNLDIVFSPVTGRNQIVSIKDIPLKKWFAITITVTYKEVGLYLNGKMVKSLVLTDYPDINNGNLEICEHGGYQGMLSSISYYPKVINAKKIAALHLLGPYTRFLDRFKKKFDKLKILAEHPLELLGCELNDKYKKKWKNMKNVAKNIANPVKALEEQKNKMKKNINKSINKTMKNATKLATSKEFRNFNKYN